MKKAFRLLSIGLSVSMLISVSACNGADTGKSASTDSQSSASTASTEKLTLKLFTSQLKENATKDSRDKALYDSIDRFMTENTNVTVIVDAVAAEPYNDKAKILAAGNELPDIFEVLGGWNKSFVESGLVMDLTDVINSDAEWKKIIKPTAVNNFIIDGKTYGICLEEGGSTTLLFYNAAILKECGLDGPPKTMTDLLAAVTAIREKGYTPISLGNKGNWVAESCYISAIGSRYTGNDWNTSIVNHGGAKFTDPDFIKGLTLLKTLADSNVFNKDLNTIDYQQARVPFYNKKAAMFIEGHWAIASILSDCPADVLKDVHVTGIPDVVGGKVANYTAGGNGGWAYALNSKLVGSSKDAAIKWLKTLISKESGNTVLSGGSPCTIDVGEDYDKSNLAPLQVEFFNFLKSVPYCVTYDLVFEPSVIDVMSKGMQELLINTVTPEDLGKRIQAEYEKTVK